MNKYLNPPSSTLGYRLANFTGFLACLGLLAYAIFYLQETLYLDPCPLCILQRIAFMALGLVFLVAALHGPRGRGRRFYGALIALAALAGAGVAGRHVWLQNTPPDPMAACGPGLDYMLEAFPFSEAMRMVFQGSGDCADLDWVFLGLGIPAWALVWFLGLGLVGVVAARRR